MTIQVAQHAVLIAHVDLVRKYRRLRSSPLRFSVVVLGFGVVFIALSLLAILGGLTAGRSLAAGGGQVEIQQIQSMVAFFLVTFHLLVAYYTISNLQEIDNRELLFSTVPTDHVLAGLVVSQFVPLSLGVGVPLVLAAASVTIESGAVIAFPTLSVVSLFGMGVSYVTGVASGFVILAATTALPISSKYKNILLWSPVILLLSVQMLGIGVEVIDTVARVLGESPIGAYIHLVLLWTGSTSAVAAVLVVCVSVGLVIGCSFAVPPLARFVWDATPPPDGPQRSRTFLLSAIPFTNQRLGRVVWFSLLRAVRAPRSVLHAALPLLFLLEPVVRVNQTGVVGPTIPLLTVLYGGWSTGALFSLDPLGSEGPMLPLTITSGLDGRTFIDGRAVASVLVGVPWTLVLTLITGILSPLSLTALGGLCVGGLALTLVAPYLAAVAGMVFPSTPSRQFEIPSGTALPSKLAFILYSIALFAVSWGLSLSVLLDQVDVSLGGLVTASIALLAGVFCRRYAAGVFDSYCLP